MTTVNIATLPDREKQLKKTVSSLINQVDKVNLWLNGYTKIPPWCISPKINTVLSGNRGDQGKFFFTDKGFKFTSDDDIIYPPDYIETLKSKIDGNIVTIHGKNFKTPCKSYYHDSLDKIRCDQEQKQDIQVQIPGTGVMGFHTDTIDFTHKDFPVMNMADIWVGIKAKKLGIPINCIAKPGNWIEIQAVKDTIWEQEHLKDGFQTQLINDNF